MPISNRMPFEDDTGTEYELVVWENEPNRIYHGDHWASFDSVQTSDVYGGNVRVSFRKGGDITTQVTVAPYVARRLKVEGEQ